MIQDWRGIEIKVGDLVVYPSRHSSSMWMVEAEVVELLPGNPDAEKYWDRIPHGLRVKRLRESLPGEIQPKLVRVQADRTTVVLSADADRHPVRYMVTTDEEGKPQAIQGLIDGGIWTVSDEGSIEIDGSA